MSILGITKLNKRKSCIWSSWNFKSILKWLINFKQNLSLINTHNWFDELNGWKVIKLQIWNSMILYIKQEMVNHTCFGVDWFNSNTHTTEFIDCVHALMPIRVCFAKSYQCSAWTLIKSHHYYYSPHHYYSIVENHVNLYINWKEHSCQRFFIIFNKYFLIICYINHQTKL